MQNFAGFSALKRSLFKGQWVRLLIYSEYSEMTDWPAHTVQRLTELNLQKFEIPNKDDGIGRVYFS